MNRTYKQFGREAWWFCTLLWSEISLSCHYSKSGEMDRANVFLNIREKKEEAMDFLGVNKEFLISHYDTTGYVLALISYEQYIGLILDPKSETLNPEKKTVESEMRLIEFRQREIEKLSKYANKNMWYLRRSINMIYLKGNSFHLPGENRKEHETLSPEKVGETNA